VWSELRLWWAGEEVQQFSVEKGVSHTLQINLDTVVHMQCKDLHINVQDAAGDRIFAGQMLERDPTRWEMWTSERMMRLLGQERGQELSPSDAAAERRRLHQESQDTHAGHVLGEVRRGTRKFPKTPRMRKGVEADACRIYGSLEGNKVQGDFHITARGHGYQEFGEHLSHESTLTGSIHFLSSTYATLFLPLLHHLHPH
jgi:Endoplasmic Reticulum-Golgi Intermediate Compartment (ERGIC)